MQLKEKIKNNKWELIFVLSLILLGIFLRAYHFSNWLHFEIDQSYDYLMVSPASEKGAENLPLLGPTAGGGRALRLGPAFYYMEYLSALFFGNNPTGHAMLVLILSIFSLPLFYVFSRKYFSRKISMGLLAIFCFSLYLVLYSRFSWSPNVLPFLVLFSFYSLIRSVSETEKNKDMWFLSAIFFIGITSQIHFNAFFIIPAVALIFLLIKRPRFKLKTWLFSAGIFLIIYSPVIINEIKTGGQDFEFFKEKISTSEEINIVEEKSEKKVGEKLFQNFRYHAYEYFLIISGKDIVNSSRPKGYSLGITCNSCKEELPWRIAGLTTFISAISLLAYKLIKEKNSEKKNFLLILALWLLMSFIYFFAITYDGLYIYPRFFLIVSPLAIILIGLIFESIKPQKIGMALFITFIIFLSYVNLSKIKDVFSQLKSAPYQNAKVEKEDIFPNNYRITQEQQLLIADYIETKFNKNNYPVYIKTIHEYEPTFWYYLEKRGIYYYDQIDPLVKYEQGNYFIIIYSNDNPKKYEQYFQGFNISEKKEFGSLTVYYLNSKPESVTSKKQSDSERKMTIQAQQISQLITWRKLFSK